MTDTGATTLNLEFWLHKALEWAPITTSESQQDICLHLPELQEFLSQIYGALKHMVSKLMGRKNCFADCYRNILHHTFGQDRKLTVAERPVVLT